MLSRRRFFQVLGGGGLTGLAAPLVACAPDAVVTAPRTAAPTALDEWAAVRDLFPLARDRIHMAGLLLASHPTPVREAIERHRRALDEDPATYWHENAPRLEDEARAAAARYLGGQPDEVALTDSTTMGLGILYTGLDLSHDQEIVTTLHDHYSTHKSLSNAAERTGATIKKVALYEHPESATEEGIAGAILHALGPKTRVLAVTWVHSSTGVRLPLATIAEVVAQANRGRDEKDRVLMCVDGVHGFGSTEDVVGRMGCDFFSAGCHKWIFGPRGTGVLWGKGDAWNAVRDAIPPFNISPDKRPGQPGAPPAYARKVTPGGFHSFEHRWALPAAFELHERLGRARVAGRIHELNRQLKEGLAKMRHVKLYTPASDALSAGLVCFDIAGMKPEEVVARLREQHIIASETPYATSYARLTPGLLNSPAEVEESLRAVRALGPS